MLKRWLLYLWTNDDGFFGIGQGPSQEQKDTSAMLTGAGTFGLGQGEGDILASDNFWKSILSNDPAQISKVLGPQMSAINKQGQQTKKTASEFGNRGGGTNAGMQAVDDTTRSSVDSMISSLTGSAAGALGQSGSSLFGQGVGATEGAFSADTTIHNEQAGKWNDIFGSIMKSVETAAIIA
jgi:hypothetical protein